MAQRKTSSEPKVAKPKKPTAPKKKFWGPPFSPVQSAFWHSEPLDKPGKEVFENRFGVYFPGGKMLRIQASLPLAESNVPRLWDITFDSPVVIGVEIDISEIYWKGMNLTQVDPKTMISMNEEGIVLIQDPFRMERSNLMSIRTLDPRVEEGESIWPMRQNGPFGAKPIPTLHQFAESLMIKFDSSSSVKCPYWLLISIDSSTPDPSQNQLPLLDVDDIVGPYPKTKEQEDLIFGLRNGSRFLAQHPEISLEAAHTIALGPDVISQALLTLNPSIPEKMWRWAAYTPALFVRNPIFPMIFDSTGLRFLDYSKNANEIKSRLVESYNKFLMESEELWEKKTM